MPVSTESNMPEIHQIEKFKFLEGSETYKLLELWDLKNLFTSAFRNGSGNRIRVVLRCQPKRTHRLGIAERRIDNLEASPFGLFSILLGRNLIKEMPYMQCHI